MSKNQDILKAICSRLLDFLIKSNEKIQNDKKSKLETENSSTNQFFKLNQELTEFLDKNSRENFNLDPIFEIIYILHNNINDSSFKFICLFSFINKSHLFGEKFRQLTVDQIKLLFSCVKIDLNNEDSHSGDLINQLESLIVTLLNNCLQEQFLTSNISTVQNFFE